ncbi:SMR family transporter [Alteromonas stellipolaris]|jgi:small multidrug resistance pump|uniref:SMR family transporter n=1 Tax=Alteromonas stellipolaris TaxID=233316 RepID=A0AAW7Z7P0_9ALTE|nr:SMR family transporter [Alteromonas stellipolaris]MBZ2164026.1 QacE family quaternary ammonium compound efflux SMR transporter [Alteromonas stellipolaris]MDO6534920.1 SMR family transporter [Alteromonas stellipolaris]MDO6540396.1 SMR family transporter [Alteromonas stellipolaris]MDO6579648.1 SMR family transporter [Alteromonas stellipolaris]MDO6626797.1 SMR family transporter [Alteromonas stellipolaris]
MTYLLLALAIVTEVTATLLLKASNGWEKWYFGYGAIAFYMISGILFAAVLKHMGVGVAYAIWSGMGIALITAASVILWKQTFDFYAAMGIILIVSGTLLITSKSAVVFQ